MGSRGIEPPTFRLRGGYSADLSYEPVFDRGRQVRAAPSRAPGGAIDVIVDMQFSQSAEMGQEGVEPPCAFAPSDFKSAPFGLSGTPPSPGTNPLVTGRSI